jgi:hypothetical protein
MPSPAPEIGAVGKGMVARAGPGTQYRGIPVWGSLFSPAVAVKDDIEQLRAFAERMKRPVVWNAHDTRCGACIDRHPLLGWIYVTEDDLEAVYFAPVVRRKTNHRAIDRQPEGYPMVPIQPGSRTMLRPPGAPRHGWFETTCPRGHVVGAEAGTMNSIGPAETIYLLPR